MKSLQLDKPHAIVTIGIQGSGKTFFAEKFAQTFNAPFIEQSLFRHYAKDTASADELMDVVLTETLKTGKSVVIELALASRNERMELSKKLKAAGYAPLYVWVQVDTDTAVNRSYRAHGISQDDYLQSMRRFSPAHQTERALVVSGKHTFATQARAVLKRLSVPRSAAASPEERKQPTRGQIFIR